jgi:hypothetical protein
MQRNLSLLLLSGIVSVGAVACGGSQSNSSSNRSAAPAETPVEEIASVRFAHFAVAPAVAVSLAGESVSSQFQPGDISDFIEAPAGAHDFVLSSPSGANEFLSTRVTFGGEGAFSVFVVGNASQNSLRTVVAEHGEAETPSNHGAIRFVNGAGGSGVLNFASGGRGFAADVRFGGVSDYVPVREGATEFDATGGMSGTFSLNVNAGTVYTVVAHMNNDTLTFTTLTE